mmetsp:Transcript_39496/g.92876  ORF Transcript_39496/g.92876 Transcript_39496/m.92876 type:complete len:1072 (+) Transcript_39496:56-3271(+)
MAREPRPSTFLREISIEYSYQDLTRATSQWSSTRQLGSGSYGAVYKGELPDGSEVAIKALNLAALGAQSETAGFEDEVRMLSKFRHPNLVTLLGWGKKDSLRYLVYELLQGGDAFQRLQKAKMQPPTGKLFMWHERLSVCLDASTGLSHMHNSKPKAFHRDIKSANILLDRHGTAKMADFGLACTAKTTQPTDLHVTVQTISGTPGYACPIYARTGRVTEGSEVYSFGMVMLELMTNHAPATADPRKPGGILYPIADTVRPNYPGDQERAMQYLDQAGQWPEELARELSVLALRCVNAREENKRPLFLEIVRALRSMMERFPANSPPQVIPPSFASQLPQVPPNMMAAGQQANGGRTPQGGGFAAQQAGQQQANRFGVSGSSPVPQPAAQPQQPSPAQAPPARPSPADINRGTASRPGGQVQPEAKAIYALDLERANSLNLSKLSAEQRRLPISATLGEGGLLTFSVGRHHQQDLFEAWLPSDSMRNCISRTAFEVTITPSGENVQLLARGANPIQVDGMPASIGRGIPLRLGSLVVFTNPSQDDLLALRFAKMTQPLTPVAPPSTPPAVSKAGAPATSPAPAAAGMVSPTWRVECLHAEGHSAPSLASLPLEHRLLALPDTGSVHIGRQHQSALFEALLRNSQRCLAFISRTHAEMEVVRGHGIMVTNLSGNPLWIDGEQLAKGNSKLVGQDRMVSFARLEGLDHVHFLKLMVKLAEGKDLPASVFIKEARGTPSPARDGSQAGSPVAAPPAFRPQPRTEARPEDAHPPAASIPPSAASPPPQDDIPKPLPKAKARAGQAAAGGGDGTVLLELAGEGVRTEMPPDQRRVGPISLVGEPLIIGRRHQREIHQNCIHDKDCLQFVSRDHLEIALVGSEFRLKALTANPIWRERSGCEAIELAQNETVSLEFGDRIVLGTGSSQLNPSEASKKLHWLFLRPSADAGRRNNGVSDSYAGRTPPSPGGDGPRMPDPSPGWGRSGGASGADAGGWEPMLPPAAETVQQRGRGWEERPSEACGPAPRLLPDDDEPFPGSGGLPQFGGTGGQAGNAGRSGGMLRPPVALDDVPEASAW